MSRNASGVYSLPSQYNPVVARSTILKDWANTTLTDVGAELTNSLDRAGRGAMTAPLQLPDGSAALPALTFSNDLDTGLYRGAANDLRFSTGGTQRAALTSAGLSIAAALEAGSTIRAGDGAVGAPAFSFTADTDTGLYRAGANDLRIATNGADRATFSTKTSLAAATAATGGTRQDALTLTNGDLDLSGVAYPTSTTAIANRLTPMNVPKIVARLSVTGGSGSNFTITVTSGFNVASVARGAATAFTLTFGSAFANTNYIVQAEWWGSTAGYTIGFNASGAVDGGSTYLTGRVNLGVYNGAVAVDLDASTATGEIRIVIYGQQ